MITKDMTIHQIIHENPQATHVLMSHRISCNLFSSSQDATLEQVAIEHGVNLEELLHSLNNCRYF